MARHTEPLLLLLRLLLFRSAKNCTHKGQHVEGNACSKLKLSMEALLTSFIKGRRFHPVLEQQKAMAVRYLNAARCSGWSPDTDVRVASAASVQSGATLV